jgi:hypothetical protein
MENLTRRKEIWTVMAIVIVTTSVVAMTKATGAILVATFLAGLGTGIALACVIITDMLIEQARRDKSKG